MAQGKKKLQEKDQHNQKPNIKVACDGRKKEGKPRHRMSRGEAHTDTMEDQYTKMWMTTDKVIIAGQTISARGVGVFLGRGRKGMKVEGEQDEDMEGSKGGQMDVWTE